MKLALTLLTAAAMAGIPIAPAHGANGDPTNDGMTCTVAKNDVLLQWNFAFLVAIKGYILERDGVKIATLDPSATRYVDQQVGAGDHAYSLSAENLNGGGIMNLASCTVTVLPGGLRCRVDGNDVHLGWDPLLIDVVVENFSIYRNGDLIASVPGNQFSYQDTVVLGDYTYRVAAVFSSTSQSTVGSCQVSVECYGLEAEVDGRKVSLKWRPGFNDPAVPILIDPTYFISRDGVAIAETHETSYVDEVPGPGVYRYEIVFDLGTGGVPAILIAACQVVVPGDGPPPPRDVTCRLMPPPFANLPGVEEVLVITWTNAADYDSILIHRDNQLLETLPGGPAGESQTFIDKDPPAGSHTWCVIGVVIDAAGNAGARSIPGCCRMDIPPVGHIVPPQNLTCTILDVAPNPDPTLPPFSVTGVLLEWENPPPGLCPICGDGYQKIVILRNGMTIASLPGTDTSFRDQVVGGGTFAYDVCGFNEMGKGCASCTVELPPGEVVPPQDFTCILVDVILRADDPDANGNLPAPGDVLPLPAVVLKWWNPMRYEGLVISRDKAIIARLPGDAMVYRDISPPAGLHVYGIYGVVSNNRVSPVVECEIVVGDRVPPVEDLFCGVQEKANPDTVDLAWKNGADYRGIVITRNGEPLAKLPGDATSYQDTGLKPGIYIYEVVGVAVVGQSAPVSCIAEIPGPPEGKLLYFSGGLLNLDPAIDAALAGAIGNRITCLAATDEEVQGWSFGVQSDPKFILAKQYDLEDTVTKAFNGGAGPAFLSVKLLAEGVTMAVVIEDGSSLPAETLPPASGHKLINIEYTAGPSGTEGEAYPVRYSNALGSPPVQVLLVVNGFEERPRTLPGWVSVPLQGFLRGDVDGNKSIDINDPVSLLNWLFLGGDQPKCMEAADTNRSRDVNIADPVYLLTFLYLAGPPPPAPFPECGSAPSPLGCADSGGCP